MSSAKTVAWVVLLLTTSAIARADNIAASNNSWVFFGNPSTSQPQAPSVAASSTSADPWSTAAVTTSPTAVSVTPQATTPPASTSPVSSALSVAAFTPVSSSAAAVNAYINFGNGPYPEQAQLTTGTAAPWYTSPAVTALFGGTPSSGQQAAFENQVLQDVQHTFSISGMDPTLTINPNTSALHTISVVSGLSYGPNSNAIGITDVGNNGFSFIDKLSYGSSVTDLEWAVAHNVSHELMHAFGIGYHPDQTGKYIDAADATWSMLTSPNTMFSSLATQVITATGYGANTGDSSGTGLERIDGDQEILAVPEPSTIVLWTVAVAGIAIHAGRKARPARVA